MLSIVILGGLGSIVGLIPAAIIVLVLPEKLQFIQEYRFLLFAALVIVHPAVPAAGPAAAQDAHLLPPGPGIMSGSDLITVDKLTMRFGGLTALDELDMTVRQGEILGLLGPNGSGKTTFFNVLTGLYKASSGRIRYAGEDVTGKSPQAIYRAGVARTFQRSRLSLSLTVFDNVVIGDYQHMQHGLVFNLLRRKAFRAEYDAYVEKVRDLLQIFSPPLVDHLFESVDSFTMIDRRRIEVCRALMSQPRLLLLDEPSAGMTHDETDELMQDILQVRGQDEGPVGGPDRA